MSEQVQALRPRSTPGVAVGGVHASGVTLSSRDVRPGDLYVGLPGTRTHGARFAADAVAAGAVAVLTDPAGADLAAGCGVPVVVDPAPRRRMGELAAAAYGHPAERLRLLGVTGTAGKTTTAGILAAGLAACGLRPGVIGTLGFSVGQEWLPAGRTTVTTPEAPDLQALLAVMLEHGADAVVMEVSSHALAQQRVAPLRFDVAAFTNLGWDHRDFHPTQEDYFAAKARLFTPALTRAAVVSVDDGWGVRLARQAAAAGLPVTTTGTAPVADAPPVSVTGRRDDPDHALVEVAGRRLRVRLPLPGDHNVANLLTALAMVEASGLDLDRAAAGVAGVRVPGRLERVPLGEGAPEVYVDFAHTPESVAEALRAVRHGRRVVAVLGAGGDRDQAKRAVMGAQAARWADVVVVTDDNPRSEDPATIRAAVLGGARDAVARAAAEGGPEAGHEVVDGGDRRAAIAVALGRAAAGDVVVVLGKGHETGQEVGGRVLPFRDADVVDEEYRRLRAAQG